MKKRSFQPVGPNRQAEVSPVVPSSRIFQAPEGVSLSPRVLRTALFDGRMDPSIPSSLVEILKSGHDYILKGKSTQVDPTEHYVRTIKRGLRPAELEESLSEWGTPQRLEELLKELQFSKESLASHERTVINLDLSATAYEGVINALVGNWSLGITGMVALLSVGALFFGHTAAFLGALPLVIVLVLRYIVLYFVEQAIAEKQQEWDAAHATPSV